MGALFNDTACESHSLMVLLFYVSRYIKPLLPKYKWIEYQSNRTCDSLVRCRTTEFMTGNTRVSKYFHYGQRYRMTEIERKNSFLSAPKMDRLSCATIVEMVPRIFDVRISAPAGVKDSTSTNHQ